MKKMLVVVAVLVLAAGAVTVLAVLGIEPLSDEFTGRWLFEQTRGLTAAIKTTLMDGHRLAKRAAHQRHDRGSATCWTRLSRANAGLRSSDTDAALLRR